MEIDKKKKETKDLLEVADTLEKEALKNAKEK